MIRVKRQLVGSYTFTVDTFNDDGDPIVPTGSYAATILDGAGLPIGTSYSATYASNQLSAVIPAVVLDTLDTYTITYAPTLLGSTQPIFTLDVEIVGGYLFEVSQLRAQDRAFADVVKYPSSALREIRTWVEQVIEGTRAAQVAFVPRGTRVKMNGNSPDLNRGYYPLLYGNDYRDLIAPDFEIRELYSASINGTALTQDEIDAVAVDDNILHRSAGVQWPAWPYGKGNISLHYSHGYDRPPGAITRAALLLAREYLVKSDLPGRATATSIGDQMFRLTIAGRDGVTGIPEVDAAIDQHGRKGYGIG